MHKTALVKERQINATEQKDPINGMENNILKIPFYFKNQD
jgi:hypothetical protein